MGSQDFRFGLKVPSSDWYWKYDLSYDQAVDKLKSMGVDFIICHNQYLPSVDTAVPGEVPVNMMEKMRQFDDRTFRQKLQEADIAYIGLARFGFNEKLMVKHGNYAIDHRGQKHEKVDWYVGACPTSDEYVEDCLRNVEMAMRELRMDGIFIGFMRYPGFWELWLPGTDGETWPEYCFCERCLGKFSASRGIELPKQTGSSLPEWIRENAREEWIRFKSLVIRDIVAKYRAVMKKYNPEGTLVLNTVPFDSKNYADYGRWMFGQDPELLDEVVDVFEIMGYHQILGQPYNWLDDVCKYFKQKTDKKVVCTVQGKALYTQGMHAGKGRAEEISVEEFEKAIRTAKGSGADGVVVFTWSDLLHKEFVEKDTIILDLLTKLFGKAG